MSLKFLIEKFHLQLSNQFKMYFQVDATNHADSSDIEYRVKTTMKKKTEKFYEIQMYRLNKTKDSELKVTQIGLSFLDITQIVVGQRKLSD